MALKHGPNLVDIDMEVESALLLLNLDGSVLSISMYLFYCMATIQSDDLSIILINFFWGLNMYIHRVSKTS